MRYSRFIIFTLIAVLVTDAFRYISWAGVSLELSTYIATFLTYISIVILINLAIIKGFVTNDIPSLIKNLFLLWIFWNIFSLVRGAIFASDYWDWKFLLFSSLPFSLIPLGFFIGKNLNIAKIIFRFVLKILFPLGFVIIPLALVTNEELYSRLMIPVTLFILFIPFLKPKWRILIIVVAIVSVFVVVGFRANIIKIAFSVLLLMIFYFRDYIWHRWLQLMHLSLFMIPLVLVVLAIGGRFNILSETSQTKGYIITNRLGLEENLVWDTRTFLYDEVLSSLNESGKMLIGEGGSGKYHSRAFSDLSGVKRGYRFSSEVGILNILLYDGLIGIIIYFLLLFTVSYIAVNHSSSYLAKMLGLFIAFRWTISFVEEYTLYDLNFYFLWLIIGMVSSVKFRMMSEEDIAQYFERIR